jgi:hypothetical protein
MAVQLCAVALYLDSVRHPPIWDDRAFVFGQTFLQDCRNLTRPLSPEGFRSVLPVRGSARPVWLTSVLADTCLGNGAVFAYRLSSIFWHAAGAALVAALAWALAAETPVCLLAGLLFAVHPLHAEAVNIITFRSDLLCLVFMILTLLLHKEAAGEDGWRRRGLLAASLGCAAAALLAKEMAVALPMLVLLLGAMLPRRPRRQWAIIAAHLVLVMLYLVFRAPRSGYVMGEHKDLFSEWRERVELPFARPAAAINTPFKCELDVPPWSRVYSQPKVRLLTMSRIFGGYLRSLAWPWRLQGDYSPRIVDSWLDAGVFLSWLAWLSLLTAAWALRRRLPLAAFGLLWIAVTLLPVTGAVKLLNLRADRYLYVPSAGLALAMAAGFGALMGRGAGWRKTAAWAGATILILAWAARTVWRNRDFSSEEAFVRATLAADDTVARGHLTLAMMGEDAGRAVDAEREYRVALRYWPQSRNVRSHFAEFLSIQGRLVEACAIFPEACGREPKTGVK